MGRSSRYVSLASAILIALSGIGCDNPLHKPECDCVHIASEAAGLDEEIRLRLSEENDIRWRSEAFGTIGPKFLDRMLDDRERIIKARAKLVQLGSVLKHAGCPWVSAFNWAKEIEETQCIHATRSRKYPTEYLIQLKCPVLEPE